MTDISYLIDHGSSGNEAVDQIRYEAYIAGMRRKEILAGMPGDPIDHLQVTFMAASQAANRARRNGPYYEGREDA